MVKPFDYFAREQRVVVLQQADFVQILCEK